MLTIDDLQVSRGGNTLFSGATLSLAPGQCLGICGANGCGKSTLLAAIRGEVEPDAGRISMPEGWRVVSVEQETPHGTQSAKAYVLAADEPLRRLRDDLARAERDQDHEAAAHLHQALEERDGYAAPARVARLLAGLGFSEEQQDQPVDSFSGGWRARLGLARALFRPSDVLMLDEPTNHLDLEAIVWLEAWLKRYPGVALLISHDRSFLDAATTHTAYFDRGEIAVMSGNYSESEAKRAQQVEQQSAEWRKQQARARELQAYVDRFRYKASKAKQAQSRLKMLERLTASAPAHARDGFEFEFPDPERISSPLLSLTKVAVGYGAEPVLSNLSLSLLPGDRIGLLGRNGAGKSTLVKLLVGELDPLAGERVEGRNLKIGYFAQHQLDALDYHRSPLEHLQDLAPEQAHQPLRDFLGHFGFRGDTALEPIAPRSGGEKSRLALALLAWQRPNLLVLDEPTNHLDLEMRHALSVALQSYAGALVLVSHDRSLMTACCDRFLKVQDGEASDFDGTVQDYTRGLGNNDGGPTAASNGVGDQRKARRQEAARARERLAPLRRRLKTIENDMQRAEAELETLREEMADPALYESGDSERISELNRSEGETRSRLEALESEWLELSEQLESSAAD